MKCALSDDLLAAHFDMGESKSKWQKIKFRVLLCGFLYPKGEFLQGIVNAIGKPNQGKVAYVLEVSFKGCHDFTERSILKSVK